MILGFTGDSPAGSGGLAGAHLVVVSRRKQRRSAGIGVLLTKLSRRQWNTGRVSLGPIEMR